MLKMLFPGWNDGLSLVFCCIIGLWLLAFIAIGLYKNLKLRMRVRRIRTGLMQLGDKVSSREDLNYVHVTDHRFQVMLGDRRNADIANQLVAYKNALLPFKSTRDSMERYCNTGEAQDHFSLHSLGPYFSEMRPITPSLLTGLGVLGTFVGLLFALQNVDLKNIASTIGGASEVNIQLDELLAGAKVAFVTSVWGISASFLSTIIYNLIVSKLLELLREFQEDLDDIYKPNVLTDRQLQAMGVRTDSVQDCITELQETLIHALSENSDRSAALIASTIRDYMRELDDRNSHAIDQAVDRFSNALTSQINNYRDVIKNAGTTFSEKVRDSANIVESKFNDWGDKFADVSVAIGNSLQSIRDDMQNWSVVSKEMCESAGKISRFGEQSAKAVDKLCTLQQELDAKLKSLSSENLSTAQHVSSLAESAVSFSATIKEAQSYTKALQESLKDIAKIKNLVNSSLTTSMQLYTKEVAEVTTELNGKWKQAYEDRLNYYENVIKLSMSQIVNATNAVNNITSKMR